jgi:hypothetical protein
MHRRADDAYSSELRGDVLITRAMPLVSASLGLYGVADIVEFHAVANEAETNKVRLKGRRGWWLPYPVEYKRGSPKKDNCDATNQKHCKTKPVAPRAGAWIETTSKSWKRFYSSGRSLCESVD